MKGNGFLFDASALYPLLDYIDKIDVKKIYILTLTFYEVGNAIWKEYYIHKKVKDPITLSMLFNDLLRRFNVVEDPPLDKVMKVAIDKGLTYYDASYVYVAESLGLTLVSNDRELIRKANAITLEELIKGV
ncbi:type II toxin-antitoxin system VapC family toxin [Acidianus infernus]|uniref:type II toxin-antitoxin system VapC family toxin n=1 Tax=Acidianus infernus TaxID=12915 RepID=UPI00359476DF